VQQSSMVRPPRHTPGQARVSNEQHALMRGLAHGVALSMVVWTAALYLTLILR
jgi:hypothetical protein